MVHLLVDLDLRHQLEFRPLFCERRFLHNFHGEGAIGVGVGQLEAFGKSAFSEELSAGVFLFLGQARPVCDLFNDGL